MVYEVYNLAPNEKSPKNNTSLRTASLVSIISVYMWKLMGRDAFSKGSVAFRVVLLVWLLHVMLSTVNTSTL